MQSHRPALIIYLSLALSPVLARAQHPGDRQYYGDWQPVPGSETLKYSHYYFKADPKDKEYQTQRVVADTTKLDAVFFLNSDNEYWCAAPTDPAKQGKWYIFEPGQEPKTIAEAYKRGLPPLRGAPPIPKTTGRDAPRMLFPTHLADLLASAR
jgi:hypothetical protein